jgi:hypothetical protein
MENLQPALSQLPVFSGHLVLEHLNETFSVGEQVDDCIFRFMWGNAIDGIGQV